MGVRALTLRASGVTRSWMLLAVQEPSQVKLVGSRREQYPSTIPGLLTAAEMDTEHKGRSQN